MDFRLLYEGHLLGQAAKADHKQQIRQALHPQLKQLWDMPPLDAMREFLAFPPKPAKVSVVLEKGNVRFAPLVTTRLHLFAELNILLFRAQPRGSLIKDGGDIDNRLKTLLDALRVPHTSSEAPCLASATADDLFFCLLEDDSLVTKVSVETEQFLRPVAPELVLAVIHVNIKKTQTTYANIAL